MLVTSIWSKQHQNNRKRAELDYPCSKWRHYLSFGFPGQCFKRFVGCTQTKPSTKRCRQLRCLEMLTHNSVVSVISFQGWHCLRRKLQVSVWSRRQTCSEQSSQVIWGLFRKANSEWKKYKDFFWHDMESAQKGTSTSTTHEALKPTRNIQGWTPCSTATYSSVHPSQHTQGEQWKNQWWPKGRTWGWIPHLDTYNRRKALEGRWKQAPSLLAEGRTALVLMETARTTWSSGWDCLLKKSELEEERVWKHLKKFKERTQLVSGYGVSQAQGRHIVGHLKKQAGIWSMGSSPCFRTTAKHPTLMLTVSGSKFPPALHTYHSSGGSCPSRALWRNRLSFQGLAERQGSGPCKQSEPLNERNAKRNGDEGLECNSCKQNHRLLLN